MILETVVSTRNPDGGAHFSPMGYRTEGEQTILSPFAPSRTLENLRREPVAVLNFTDDVSVIAGCLTGRRDWPKVETNEISGWRLSDTLAHRELRLVHMVDDKVRPTFVYRTECECMHAPFKGFNRAQAAVIEAAILFTRLDWLPPEKVSDEMEYLKIAIDKTAGHKELTAWKWLAEAIRAHPKHDIGRIPGI